MLEFLTLSKRKSNIESPSPENLLNDLQTEKKSITHKFDLQNGKTRTITITPNNPADIDKLVKIALPMKENYNHIFVA